jgi:hypothetical protein
MFAASHGVRSSAAAPVSSARSLARAAVCWANASCSRPTSAALQHELRPRSDLLVARLLRHEAADREHEAGIGVEGGLTGSAVADGVVEAALHEQAHRGRANQVARLPLLAFAPARLAAHVGNSIILARVTKR